jgi:hypothetical protein
MRLALVETACPVCAGVAPVVVRVVPAPFKAVADDVTPVVAVAELELAVAAPPGPDAAGRDRSSQDLGVGSRL